jgi:ABC-type multidrug transport system fused ATPase/permease subunit
MDTLISYSLIFSPFVFLYFFYTLYRILMKEEKSILWFISFIALIFSILISYRQRILIDDFAPYVVVSVPLMVRLFMNSYRIRLPENRRGHKALFIVVFAMLIVNFVVTYTYQYLYLFLQKPKYHFAYKYNIAKELASELKKLGVHEVAADKKMQKRLAFYRIGKSTRYMLSTKPSTDESKKVTISYKNRVVKTYFVSKVNN